MRVLVDTCIVIDALQNREPFNAFAQKVFLAAANEKFDGFITAKSVTDIYYLAHRATHSDNETRNILLKLFDIFDIVDTYASDCKNAVFSKVSDYEDAVMIETAVRTDMDAIVTRNQKDFTDSSIPVYLPEEFLAILGEN